MLSDVFSTHPQLASKCLEHFVNGIHGPRGQVTHCDILLQRQKWQTELGKTNRKESLAAARLQCFQSGSLLTHTRLQKTQR